MTPVLYHYWRSSSSFRVRWALRLKGIAYQAVAVDLLAGEQETEAHRQRNPAVAVPVLQMGERYLSESVAIIEYLDEVYPLPPLLPAGPVDRARVRQLVQTINAGTQPMQNRGVLLHYSKDPEEQKRWARHFIGRGLSVYEALVGQGQQAGRYSHGDSVTMADLYLVPQCYNARRFGVDLTQWPHISRIEANCLATQEAQEASPDRQAR